MNELAIIDFIRKTRNNANMKAFRDANKERLRDTWAEASRAYRAANPDKARAATRKSKAKYRAEHPEEYREKNRQYRIGRLDQHRNYDLKSKYGITWQDYETMAAAQAGKCAICAGPPDKVANGKQDCPPRFCVDHDHTTGEVRGLLCGFCNQLLGRAKDSIENLLAAAEYLRQRRRSN